MKEIPRFIKYSRVSHACFIICVIIGVAAIKAGGLILVSAGVLTVLYSFIMDRLFKKLGIGFHYKRPHRIVPANSDNRPIDVEWKFVKEENHAKIGRT